MALPFIIANLPAGNNPASILDQNFAALGVGMNVACNAGGTANAIQLTPIANMPTVSAYQNNMLFGFQAQSTSSGPVTAAVSGLAALPVYTSAGVQAASGSIVANFGYMLMYVANLVGGTSPGFVLINAAAASQTQAQLLGGQYQAMSIKVASNSTINLVFNQVVLSNAAGGTVLQGPGNFTINTTNNNVVNGYDQVTGTLAQATWYAIFAIYNPTTLVLGGYMSSSPSNPNLPSGFTYFVRLGWVRTAPTNTSLMGTIQQGRRAQYVGGLAQTTCLPNMAFGPAGTYSTTAPTWAAVATGNFVPPTASKIRLLFNTQTAISSPNPATGIAAAPNNTYGGYLNATAPSGNIPPFQIGTTANPVVPGIYPAEFDLESTNVYWATSGAGAAGAAMYCYGWEDNL